MKRSIRVTITRTRRQTVTVPAGILYAPCPACGREVVTLSKTQALEDMGLEEEALDDLAAAGRAHVIQTVGVSDRVCLDSLLGKSLSAQAK